jgi:hypothetical protein
MKRGKKAARMQLDEILEQDKLTCHRVDPIVQDPCVTYSTDGEIVQNRTTSLTAVQVVEVEVCQGVALDDYLHYFHSGARLVADIAIFPILLLHAQGKRAGLWWKSADVNQVAQISFSSCQSQYQRGPFEHLRFSCPSILEKMISQYRTHQEVVKQVS